MLLSLESEPNCARGKRELYQVNIGPQMGEGCCNLHIFNYLNSTPKKWKPKNFKYLSYSSIIQFKNVALTLTVKSVGGPKNCILPATGPVGMLRLQRRQAGADIHCNSRHYFNQKTPFLKHKNVNLKILAEVKVVCTDFRRPKSINTTHLRQK